LSLDAEPQVLNIFPNPTTGDLTISCVQAILSIQFYDMQGQLVLNHLNVDQTERRLNLDQFNSGVYSILVQTTRGVINERVVVMKD